MPRFCVGCHSSREIAHLSHKRGTVAPAQCKYASYVSLKRAGIPFIQSGFASYVSCGLFKPLLETLVLHKPQLMLSAACLSRELVNLVPRVHVPFGQHQDTELWNNQFPETKILGLPASQPMRGLV